MKIAAAAIAGLVLSMHGAFAADDLKPQQQRMRACNTKADQKGLVNGERNHFMRSCLKGRSGNGHELTARQRRSEECNDKARAQKLEGAERRGFLSECEKPPVKQEAADPEKMKRCAKRAGDRRLEGEDLERYLNGCRSALKVSAGR